MGEDKSGLVQNDAGNKKYVIYLSNEHDFTHTIEDDSKTLGEIYLIRRTRKARYENHDLRDVVFDEETQTLVTFMGDRQGRHTFTGRIIKKRPKHNHYDVKNIKVYLVLIEPGIFGCDNVPSLDSGVDGNSEYTLVYTSTRTQLPVTERLAVVMDITDGMGGILIIDPFQVSYSVMTSIPI